MSEEFKKKFFDYDNDGCVTVADVLKVIATLVFIVLSIVMVVLEGLTEGKQYSDIQMIAVFATACGIPIFTYLIDKKYSDSKQP